MIFPEIKSLFKYMPWTPYTKDSLEKENFWFSAPKSFNDPLDCEIYLETRGNTPVFAESLASVHQKIRVAVTEIGKGIRKPEEISGVINSFAKNINEKAPIIGQELQDAVSDSAAVNKLRSKFKQLGILCLSEINDNILMWSHYAAQHTGICVEFDRSDNNVLGNKEFTLPVRYSIKAPIIDAKTYRTAEPKTQLEIERSLVFTKSADWTYEREWRLIKQGAGNSPLPIDAKIKSIILGLRAEKETVEFILSLKKKLGFEVKHIRRKSNEFGLLVEKGIFEERAQAPY